VCVCVGGKLSDGVEKDNNAHWTDAFLVNQINAGDLWKHSLCTFRVCLDGERNSERIILFGLVVENNLRLVISQEMWE
jgi:hypothetical protein